MKARVFAYIAGLAPRTLLLAMGGLFLVLALEGWLLLLRQPAAEFMQARRERIALESHARAPQQLPADIERVERELAALNEKLTGAAPQSAPERMVAEVVDRLAAVAARHRAALHGVRPAGARRVLMFDELAFDIQAAGPYASLVAWLQDVERELGPLVVTQFSIKRDASPGALSMALRVAAYRLAESGAEVK